MPLTAEDQHHLEVASGFIEQCVYANAIDELNRVSFRSQTLPEVLALWLQVYSGLKRWEPMQAVARGLVLGEPRNVRWWIACAQATREMNRISEARIILVKALEHFPDCAGVLYELARCDFQLGDHTSARERLHRAFALDPSMRSKALEDEEIALAWKDT